MPRPLLLLLLFFGLALAACRTDADPAVEEAPATASGGTAPADTTYKDGQWEDEIAAFEASDRQQMPPENAVLFVGSSSIRMWETLQEDFASVPVINRGFGGSEIEDATHYADRIVTPYAPRMIVLYAGDNDVAAGNTAETVLADFQEFVEVVRDELPAVPIAFLAIKPSLARWSTADTMQTANAMVASYVDGREGLSFIDVWTPMLNDDGTPRHELFLEDGLHMNAEGYALWAELVRPYLPGDE